MIKTREQAVQYIADKVNEAQGALYDAQGVANQFNLGFSFEPSYGMGGYYDGEAGEWNPSSLSC